MNIRKVNKKIKKNYVIILWMYHYVSDDILGHKWLKEFQYKQLIKLCGRIKFKQVRKSKYYDDYKRVCMYGVNIILTNNKTQKIEI